jgi:plasmid maintenance system antidote protein VapI
MGLAAKDIAREPQPSSEVLHSLLHVINNEVRTSAAERPAPDEHDKLDLEQLIEVLMLAREAINEQIKGASKMMAQIARYDEIEKAYQSEKRAVLQLRDERDLWKERALMVTNWVKNS